MDYNERRGIRLGQRGGHLFHGRYYAIVYEKDEYLLALVRYIHLNPVGARLVKKPNSVFTQVMLSIAEARLVLNMLGGKLIRDSYSKR